MRNPRSLQILIVLAVVLVGVFLYTRDVKGLAKEEQGDLETASAPKEITDNLNLDEFSRAGKNIINKNLASEIVNLEAKYIKASEGVQKANAAADLARKWDDVGQLNPSAMYFEIAAQNEQNLNNWINSGNAYLKAFESSQDTSINPALLKRANLSYQKAFDLDSLSIDAKTGLGTTIVNGMGMPMQGIAMLLEVVEKEPKNVKANLNLGIFSIKSGQFDKAIDRFKTVIEVKKSPEAYFYLATAYDNLGKNKEAIDAYLESKKLAANETLSTFIDKRVVELKNKN